MSNQLPTVKSIVVLMLENRSFDSLLGFLYTKQGNKSPNGDPFDGLTGKEWNPRYPTGPDRVPVRAETASSTVPDPDPGEEFDHIKAQLFTPPGVTNMGFVLDYAAVVKGSKKPQADVAQIMHCYDPSMLRCLRQIAEKYAVCDAWYASVPSQTWPNRSFAHCGWSNGHVNNWPYDPLLWDVQTIFNEMAGKKSWFVYYDEAFISLTRLQLPRLWPHGYSKNFKPLAEFYKDANSGHLPNYAFLEPNFFHNPITGALASDQHPPHDVVVGDTLIGQIYNAIVTSPQWKANEVLLVITHDEHGGCYDHVLPPSNATPPGPGTGEEHFDFKRFGVRVPLVVVSPYVPKGSVFRAPQGKTFDHTSILATVERRFGLNALKDREKVAPDLGPALSLAAPRTDSAPIVFPPQVETFATMALQDAEDTELNDLQRSIVEAVKKATVEAPARVPEMAAAAALPLMAPAESVRTVGEAQRYIQEARRRLRI